MTESLAVLADHVEHRVLLDVHVDGVEHQADGGRADPGDQVGRLGRGVGEADLQMVDRLDDDRDATVLRHAATRVKASAIRSFAMAGSGSSERRPWRSPTTSERVELGRHLDVLDQPGDRPIADGTRRDVDSDSPSFAYDQPDSSDTTGRDSSAARAARSSTAKPSGWVAWISTPSYPSSASTAIRADSSVKSGHRLVDDVAELHPGSGRRVSRSPAIVSPMISARSSS